MAGAEQQVVPAKAIDLRFAFEGKLPGEAALVACLAYAEKVRETMDPDIRRRLDALNVAIAEAFWGAFGIRGS